jgi:hypothetical protein
MRIPLAVLSLALLSLPGVAAARDPKSIPNLGVVEVWTWDQPVSVFVTHIQGDAAKALYNVTLAKIEERWDVTGKTFEKKGDALRCFRYPKPSLLQPREYLCVLNFREDGGVVSWKAN